MGRGTALRHQELLRYFDYHNTDRAHAGRWTRGRTPESVIGKASYGRDAQPDVSAVPVTGQFSAANQSHRNAALRSRDRDRDVDRLAEQVWGPGRRETESYMPARFTVSGVAVERPSANSSRKAALTGSGAPRMYETQTPSSRA